jgi:DNA-binding NarL/FixJ family response regulator
MKQKRSESSHATPKMELQWHPWLALYGREHSVASRSRILIADDHLLVAEACKRLLESEFDVVGIVTDGRDLVNAATALRPDLVLVDIAMPSLNGLDACSQIKKLHQHVRVVFLTMTDLAEVAAEAFRRGASGYVLKYCTTDELCIAVRSVLRGGSYLSPMITKETVDFLLRSTPENSESKSISQRQREVLHLLAEGKSMKEVAFTLNVKPGTVAFHKYKMMDKLNIRTNAELLEYAIRKHMVVDNQNRLRQCG